MGTPRASGGDTANQASSSTGDYGGGSASGPGAPGAQIVANAQTTNSRWFLDHSADIAAAVRNAMLNLSSLNDVVNDL
jgi:hypothetical protein